MRLPPIGGGVMRGPDRVVFEAAGNFRDDWIDAHISEEEAYALLEALRLFSAATKSQIQGSKVTVNADNMTLFYASRNGKPSNTRLHEIVTTLFWLSRSKVAPSTFL